MAADPGPPREYQWRPPGWAAPITQVLALTGFAVSAYLTVVHFTAPTALSCPDTGLVNCTKVTTGPQSMFLGVVPVALAGLVYYLAMLALVTRGAWRSARAGVRRARVAAAVAGIVTVCYLVYVELVVVGAICLYCTAVHLVTFALFVAILTATALAPAADPAYSSP